jgi:hypothetical protein
VEGLLEESPVRVTESVEVVVRVGLLETLTVVEPDVEGLRVPERD